MLVAAETVNTTMQNATAVQDCEFDKAVVDYVQMSIDRTGTSMMAVSKVHTSQG